MEPRPWSEEGATEIEKALLRAGRAEGPRKGADLRILASLQASPPPTVKPAMLNRWMKLGLIAVVAGGAAVVAHRLSRPHAVPPPVTPASSPVPKTVAPVAAPAEGEAAREEESPSVRDDGNAQARRAAATGRIRKAPRQLDDSPLDHSLRDETKALDRAREALDAHRPAEVLRLLDEYRRKFPQGRLRPEAMILRLAALLAADRHQAADSLASQLLSDAAYEAYVPRIQSLLREAKR
jgi:hypothetical protein